MTSSPVSKIAELPHYILRGLLQATQECTLQTEEEGGILCHKPDTQECRFERLLNSHSGTPQAHTLFEPDYQVIGETFQRIVKEHWRVYGSFHTHPSFSPTPSGIDHALLFRSFSLNVIWAPKQGTLSLSRWDLSGEKPQLQTTYSTIEHVKEILR